MEDIFKTECRLRKALIRISRDVDRQTVRSIIDYFGSTLKNYSLNNCSSEYMLQKWIEYVESDKEENVAALRKANELVLQYNLFPGEIFTDPEDTLTSILEYDYYVRPRTKTQYMREEEEARAGLNGKFPCEPPEGPPAGNS